MTQSAISSLTVSDQEILSNLPKKRKNLDPREANQGWEKKRTKKIKRPNYFEYHRNYLVDDPGCTTSPLLAERVDSNSLSEHGLQNCENQNKE